MIGVRMDPLDGQIASLVGSLKQFPNHIGRKHIVAAIGRGVRPFRSVMVKATPPGGVKKGRPGKGLKKRSTGQLRRSVKVITSKSKNSRTGGFAVMGYQGGDQSLKAIWLEYGTKTGIAPRNIIRTVMAELTPKVKTRLPAELAKALEKAAAELAAGKNPGGRRR